MSYVFDYYQYRRKINKKSSFSFVIIFLLIIVLLGAAVFLTSNSSQGYDEFYFVEINSFSTYAKAQALAAEIQQAGGAGYIYYNGKYRVLACFYPTEDDAKSVKENLLADYPSCAVFSLESSKFSGKSDLTDSQNALISDMIDENAALINSLYKAVIAYDSASLSLSVLKVNLESLKSDFEKAYSQFLSSFSTAKSLLSARSKLASISESIDDLIAASSNSQELSYKLKYYLVKIVVNHVSFLCCL